MQLYKVLLFGTLCRLGVLSLIILFDVVFPDYDSSAALVLDCSGVPLDGPDQWGDRVVVWDSVFFMRVAQCGYEYEQYHAFFPALPRLLQSITELCPNRTCIIIFGLMTSNLAYAISAMLFAKLTEQIVRDEWCIVAGLLFYCLPPSSVFLSVLYTESYFALLTMSGLCLLFVYDAPVLSAVIFGLSTTFRSNGVLHAGYLAHYQLRRALARKNKAVLEFVKCVVYVVICLAPFFWFQSFGYYQFCPPKDTNFSSRSWCNQKLPYLYGFVQKQYWNVGFMSYYKLNQVPNFLLAAPVLLISLHGLFAYIKQNMQHGLGLGLVQQSNARKGFFSVQVAPFIWQNGLMAIFSLLLMHVQVSTRFLSSSPALYWYMGQLSKHKLLQRLLVFYCLSYMFLGALLFPNFYPWS